MLAKFLSNNSGTTAVTYVDDVFSAYTYTGNGSTQTITNGIDLSGQGGMVWSKRRDAAQNPGIFDTVNGVGVSLNPTSTAAHLATSPDITSFNSDGVTYGAPGTYIYNFNGGSYVNWTFRKAPKFFDVVTWTGNSTPRTIAHSLGSAPGMIMVKKTNTADSWYVYHRSLGNGGVLYLEQTAAAGTGSSYWNSTDPTASVFSVGGNTGVNGTGNTYVAYLFAHDTGTDGIVQCGSFTTDGSGNATVNLGWEPQYVMLKQTNAANNWQIFDTSRAFTATDGTAKELDANLNSTEYTYPTGTFKPTATGFQAPVGFLSATATYIYLAIRRPNKPPTVGTQVYNAIARTGTGAAATVTGVGFAPDLLISKYREVNSVASLHTRLNGTAKQFTIDASAVLSRPDEVTAFGMGGYSLGTSVVQGLTNFNTKSYVYFSFRRAPLFMDVVYTTGQAFGPSAHNLRAVPELIITKGIGATNVTVLYGPAAAGNTLYMNQTAAVSSIGDISAYTSISNFCTYASGGINEKVHILFATLAGISKVGTYTGNATTNQINCGFTTGARFVLIKRTDSTGDWYIWDTLRGIIAGNDPYVLLNSTAAEVTTTDYIDAYTSGFELSSTAPAAINASGGTYLYLAIT